MDVKRLQEFQYILGDRRIYFLQYVLKKYNRFGTYFSFKDNKLNKNMIFTFTCDTEKQKRMVVPPSADYLEAFNAELSNTTKPFLVIPVLMKNKLNCKRKNGSRHMLFILVNKLTHEVERIDIRKYHVDGFSLKLFVSHLNGSFNKGFIAKVNSESKVTKDLDVPLSFMKTINVLTPRDAYPLFILSYLEMRNKYPKMNSNKVIDKVSSSITPKKTTTLWNDYVAFRSNFQSECETGLIPNPETLCCLKPLSKVIRNQMVNIPPKHCSKKQEFDPLLRKCVRKGTVSKINIMLGEALASNHDVNEQLKHLDSNIYVVMATWNFILSKHPHAFLIYPRNIPLSKLNKHDTKISWKASSRRLLLPNQFWTLWDFAIQDPSIRFIAISVHLASTDGGNHANVLLYDKDTNEMERFDGLGKDIAEAYHIEDFDQKITELFPTVTYFKPIDYCPAKMPVFQSKELDEIPGVDLKGNCAVWRIWYIDVRLSNPHLDRKKLIDLASKKLKNEAGSLHKFIKMYQKYLLSNMRKP